MKLELLGEEKILLKAYNDFDRNPELLAKFDNTIKYLSAMSISADF